MVKIEPLEEWAPSDKCLSVMENRFFYKFIQKFFINSTPLYFIVKWLNFLLITCTSYFIKYLKTSYFLLFWLTEIVS